MTRNESFNYGSFDRAEATSYGPFPDIDPEFDR
jgi:hypothetical protein